MDTAPEKSDATRALLTRLWQRNMPLLLERLSILDNAAGAASDGVLSSKIKARAIAEAHNLAGSLGMFGYPEGTEVARKIEHLLEAPTPPSPERLSQLTKALRATLFPSN